MSDRILLLVDGLAIVYRAFHAIRDLRASDGKPTNAVYGFVRMWQQLVRKHKPTHATVIFDGGLPGSRLAVLADYKAQRPAMPEALRQQLPDINEFLKAARVTALRLEGEEADDVIATLAMRAEREGFRVLVASNDKDLWQIVGERIAMVPPTKNEQIIGPAEIQERTGLVPEKIPEWLALTGDAVDNIPGIPGVGEKTATQLLRRFGSLSALQERLSEIDNDRLRVALSEYWPTIERNLAIVRLKRDVAIPGGWEDFRLREPDWSALMTFYERMEFRTLAEEVRRKGEQGPVLDLGL